MTIETDCMVVNLHISKWAGFRHDKAASRQVSQNTGAEDDVARVNKRLVRKEATAGIDKAATTLRTHFYESTMPWKDNGDRIITREAFLTFIEEHSDLMNRYDAEVEKFLTDTYQREVERSAFRMGSMYDPGEFPHVDILRQKFHAKLVVDAVTTPGDFRVGLSQEAADRIKDTMAEQHQQRVATAVADLWGRVRERLSHFHEKTSMENPRLYQSMLDNLADLVSVVPKLNFTNDEKLNDLVDQIEHYLLTNDIDDLRKNVNSRKAAAAESKRIMDDFGGLLNAFGGD